MVPRITDADYARYRAIFEEADRERRGYLTGTEARPMLLQSGLPTTDLKTIWDLADPEESGNLDARRFAVVQHLIQHRLGGHDLPMSLPLGIVAAVTESDNDKPAGVRFAPAHTSFVASQVSEGGSTTQPGPESIWPQHHALTGTCSMHPLPCNVESTVLGKPEQQLLQDYLRHLESFASMDKNDRMYLTGVEARTHFAHSGLQTEELKIIWDLADLTADGMLNAHEYAIAMLLIQVRQRGDNIPTSLPALVRTGWGRAPAAPESGLTEILDPKGDDMGGSAFNFIAGSLSALHMCHGGSDSRERIHSGDHETMLQVSSNMHGSSTLTVDVGLKGPTRVNGGNDTSMDQSTKIHIASHPAESRDCPLPSPRQLMQHDTDLSESENFIIEEWVASLKPKSNQLKVNPERDENALLPPSAESDDKVVFTTDWMSFDTGPDDLFDAPQAPASAPTMACSSTGFELGAPRSAPTVGGASSTLLSGPFQASDLMGLSGAASLPSIQMDSTPLGKAAPADFIIDSLPANAPPTAWVAQELFPAASAATPQVPPSPLTRSSSFPALAATGIDGLVRQTNAMKTCEFSSDFLSKSAAEVANSPPSARSPSLSSQSGAVSSPPCRPPPKPPISGRSRSSISTAYAPAPLTASRSHPPMSVLDSLPPVTPPPPRPQQPKSLPPAPQQMSTSDLLLELLEPMPAAMQWAPAEAKIATNAKRIPPPPPPRKTPPLSSQPSAPLRTHVPDDPFADFLDTLRDDERTTMSALQPPEEMDERQAKGVEQTWSAGEKVGDFGLFLETLRENEQNLEQIGSNTDGLVRISPATTANGSLSSSPSPSRAGENQPTASARIFHQGALVNISPSKGFVPRLWCPGGTPRNEMAEIRKAPESDDLASNVQEKEDRMLKLHSQIKHIQQIEHDLAARMMDEAHPKQRAEGIQKAEQEIRHLKKEYDKVCRQVEARKLMKEKEMLLCKARELLKRKEEEEKAQAAAAREAMKREREQKEREKERRKAEAEKEKARLRAAAAALEATQRELEQKKKDQEKKRAAAAAKKRSEANAEAARIKAASDAQKKGKAELDKQARLRHDEKRRQQIEARRAEEAAWAKQQQRLQREAEEAQHRKLREEEARQRKLQEEEQRRAEEELIRAEEALSRAEAAALRCSKTRASLKSRGSLHRDEDQPCQNFDQKPLSNISGLRECTRSCHESPLVSGLSQASVSGQLSLTYTLTLSPAREHIRRLLQHRIAEELDMDLESVNVRNVQSGTVNFDVHLGSRACSKTGSRPISEGQDHYSALKRVLETVSFPLVPTKVSSLYFPPISDQANTSVGTSAFPRSQSTESFFTPRRNLCGPTETEMSPRGTEWFHQRVVNLVKEKAKAEMEQLEQELLKVIQAMEEATLSDNVALALSEGIVSPQELESLEFGVLDRVAYESTFRTPNSPQRTPDTASTQPAQQSLTPQAPMHSKAEPDLESLHNVNGMPSDGLDDDQFVSSPEGCDQLVEIASAGATSPGQRHKNRKGAIGIERDKFYQSSNADRQTERQAPVRETRIVSNDIAWHAIGRELRAERAEQVGPGGTASSPLMGNQHTQVAGVGSMRLEQFLSCLDSLNKPGDEVTVIAGMKQHMASIEAARRGCEALLVLTPNLEGQELEQLWQSDAEWQRVSRGMQARYSNLGSRGTAEVVISAMTEHLRCADISATSSRILLLLARNEDIRQDVVKKKGVLAIMRAMDTHACVPKVQEYGCGALRNLALNCWQTSNAIADANGIELLLAAMQRNSKHSRIMQQACCALNNLCVSPPLRSRIAESGAVPLVAEAMQREFVHDWRVQRCSSTLLLTLEAEIKQIADDLIANSPPKQTESVSAAQVRKTTDVGDVELIMRSSTEHLRRSDQPAKECDEKEDRQETASTDYLNQKEATGTELHTSLRPTENLLSKNMIVPVPKSASPGFFSQSQAPYGTANKISQNFCISFDSLQETDKTYRKPHSWTASPAASPSGSGQDMEEMMCNALFFATAQEGLSSNSLMTMGSGLGDLISSLIPLTAFGSEASCRRLQELRRSAIFKAALVDYQSRPVNVPARGMQEVTAAEKAALELIFEEEDRQLSDDEAHTLVQQDIWPRTLQIGFEDAKANYFENGRSDCQSLKN